jgi:hypothetical protein
MPRAEGDVQKIIAAYILMGIGDRFWAVSWRFLAIAASYRKFLAICNVRGTAANLVWLGRSSGRHPWGVG